MDKRHPSERLRELRTSRGYRSAAAAAEAMAVNRYTYSQHENGTRELTVETAQRYADFFRSTLDYLLNGRQQKPKRLPLSLRLYGKVGAGAVVDMPDDPAADPGLDTLELPTDDLGLLQVSGDSMLPRYLDGDLVVFRLDAVSPDSVVDQFAIVQIEGDGTRLIKLVRRGKGGVFHLESLNAKTLTDVRVRAAWRIWGVITG